jgi:hypothetical protein
MTVFRGGAHELPVPRTTVDARSVAIALAAALAVTLAVLAIVLSTSGGGTDQVRVAPSSSGPIPPSPAERHQQPGLSGPGMRP